MIRPAPRALFALLLTFLATTFGATACLGADVPGGGNGAAAPSSPGGLPAGGSLVAQSSQAMAALNSVHFDMKVDGTVGGFSVSSASGQVTRAGEAHGSATLTRGGQSGETRFVLADGSLYLQAPGGDFQKLPAEAATTVYDPRVLLDPQRGVPAILSAATGARTEGQEAIAGVQTYRVAATLPAEPVAAVVPGAAGELNGQLWIAAEDHRLMRMRVPVSGGAVTVNFNDFDAPVEISPPTTS